MTPRACTVADAFVYVMRYVTRSPAPTLSAPTMTFCTDSIGVLIDVAAGCEVTGATPSFSVATFVSAPAAASRRPRRGR